MIQKNRQDIDLINKTPSRRAVMLGLLTSTATVPSICRAGLLPALAPLHFLPQGTGAAAGSDWDDALPLDKITEFAVGSQPGRHFLCAVNAMDAPMGWDRPQIMWNCGGVPGAPVSLSFGMLSQEGVFEQPRHQDDTPPVFQMLGSETGPDERPDVGGDPFVIFGRESSHVRISGPAYLRSGGEGFFQFDAHRPLRDIEFSNIHARSVGRVIETQDNTAIEGLTVKDCTALGMIRGFARFHELSEAVFHDLDLDADLVDGGGGMVCQIISVSAGRDLEFRNVRLANAVNMLAAEERGSTYIQGDGLVLEEETRDVRIDNCHAVEMGDGGFDLKSENVHMTNCTTVRCKLGIRIWSHHPDNLIENCSMIEPVTRPRNQGSCLWLAGKVTARECVMEAIDDMSPIRFGDGSDGKPDAELLIQGGVITHAEDVGLVTGSAGLVTLENVMVNGVETSGAFRWTGRRLRSI